MNAFFQILIERAISLLEAFFRWANQERRLSSREEPASRPQPRLAHRLSAG